MLDDSAASYKKAIVSYIDTLGFTEMIEKSRKDPTEVVKLRDRLAAMRQVATENSEHRKDSGENIPVVFDSFSFSDLIVRCTEIRNDPPWFILLMAELSYLATRQSGLVAEGVLVRGGISVGDIFVDSEKRVVFGPALVTSYELERKQATYPRIVIDRELAREAANITFLPPLRDLIRRGEDGTHFLDYLYGPLVIQWTPVMTSDRRKQLLIAHRQTIETCLQEDSKHKDEHLKQKHRWLALYHNDVIERMGQRLGAEIQDSRASFLIPANHPSL